MQELPQIDDFRQLLLSGKPLMDTRAPIEFKDGAFPNTVNLPLMTDDERQIVGTCYKQQGHDAAVQLGHKIVSGEVKEERISAWKDWISEQPETVLYCFRGGMRSRISQQWIYEETGITIPRVKGGYKALRRFLIDETDRLARSMEMLVLSGRTGSGKTRYMKQFSDIIDLEGLANHRGSAFGRAVTPQPSQINFENQLAIELLKKEEAGRTRLLYEDEGKNVGSVHLPLSVLNTLRSSPIVLMEVSEEERINVSFQEYVVDTLQSYVDYYGEERGNEEFGLYLLDSLGRIRKRLGGVRYSACKDIMENALASQKQTGRLLQHKEWIQYILLEYYDPMYDYQITNKQDRIVFTGDQKAVSEYLSNQAIQ